MSSNPNNQTQSNAPFFDTEEDGIDFIALAKTMWNGRKIIILCACFGVLLGGLMAFLAPTTYTAKTIMVPQMGKSSNSSSLSSLASLAGFDLGSMSQSSSELSPLIYPQILNSIPFKLELMNIPVHFSGIDSAVSVYDYYTTYKKTTVISQVKKYTVGLPSVIMQSLRGGEKPRMSPKGKTLAPLTFTKEQALIKGLLDKQVQLIVEKKEGYITLTATMEDPLVAAELAQKAQQILQDFITKFKVEKSQAELDFIQERYNIAKAQAEGYQYNIAASSDRYKDLVSKVPLVSNDRLQTKYSLYNSVYLELAKQLEQAKIQVKKDTPIFTVVEPVSIPTEKDGSGRVQTLFAWVLFGFVMGIVVVFSKQWFMVVKAKWQIV